MDGLARTRTGGRRITPIGGIALLTVIVVAALSLVFLFSGRNSYRRSIEGVIDRFELADLAMRAQVDFKVEVQEWKNLLLRGGDPEDFERYRASGLAARQRVRESLEQIAGSEQFAEAVRGKAARIAAEMQAIAIRYDTAIEGVDLAAPGAAARVDASVRGIDREPMRLVESLSESLDAEAFESLRLADEASEQRFRTYQRWLYLACGLTIVATLLAVSRPRP